MVSQKFAALGAGAAAALIFASATMAQTTPAGPKPYTPTGAAPAAAAAPAPTPVSHGPALPGVCVFSSQRAIGTSTVGKFVNTRLQQIVTQVNSELSTEKTAIDTEAKTLDAGRATMDQTTLEQRGSALQVRANALQRKAQLRDREIDATEQKALMRVAQEMDPIVKQIYQQRVCSMLLNRDGAVILANPQMDITDAVIAGTNAKIQQFSFDREKLDGPAAAAKPAGTP